MLESHLRAGVRGRQHLHQLLCQTLRMHVPVSHFRLLLIMTGYDSVFRQGRLYGLPPPQPPPPSEPETLIPLARSRMAAPEPTFPSEDGYETEKETAVTTNPDGPQRVTLTWP